MPRAAHAVVSLVGMFLVLSGGVAGAAPPTKEGASTLEGEMLIWSGGKTRAEAELQQKGLKAYLEVLDAVLPVTPAVLESARVEGLKPGFFVVALGVCPKDQVQEPLSLFQVIYPDVYTRTVKYQPTDKTPKLGCPEMEAAATNDADEPVLWSLEHTGRVVQGGKTLVGLAFTYSWSQMGDFAQAFHDVKAIYLLIDSKKRRLLDSEVYDGPSDATTLESFTTEEGRLVSSIKYGDPRCEPGSDYFKGWRTTVKVSIAKGSIKLSSAKPTLLEKGSCGYADEERMILGEDHYQEEAPEED